MENDGRTYVVTGSGLVNCTFDGQTLISLLKAIGKSGRSLMIREIVRGEMQKHDALKTNKTTGWIKTQDRMPEMRRAWPEDSARSQHVLIALKIPSSYDGHNGRVREAMLVEQHSKLVMPSERGTLTPLIPVGNVWICAGSKAYPLAEVSHWMPLPDPPAAP